MLLRGNGGRDLGNDDDDGDNDDDGDDNDDDDDGDDDDANKQKGLENNVIIIII